MGELLNHYGYLALSIGTFFEGETALLIASSLSGSGFFRLQNTIFFGFLGSFISDWIYFAIGRINGKYFIEKRPSLKLKLSPVSRFFKKNELQLLLSYRFLYGFRVLIPLIIGMSEITLSKFFLYSMFTGLLWSTLVCSLGYLVGVYFNLDAIFFENNIYFILIGFALFGLVIGYTVKRVAEKKLLTGH